MITQLLHKSFAISLALLVLLSTFSVTIEKHFCGDVLVDVAVFLEAEKCGMEAAELELAAITKKPCCKDTIDVIKGQDELKVTSFEDLDFELQVFVSTFMNSYANLFECLPKQVISHKDYVPPNLVYDIHILDEVFLI